MFDPFNRVKDVQVSSMVVLTPVVTGLTTYLWMGKGSGDEYSTNARIKVSNVRDHFSTVNNFSIKIQTSAIEGVAKIPFKTILEFVKLNKKLLLKFYSETGFTSSHLIDEIQKL